MALKPPIRGAIAQDSGYALPYANGAIAWANQLHGDVKALWDAAILPTTTMSGTGDAMVATCTPAPPALVNGMAFWIDPPGANTAADPVLDVGTGAVIVRDRNGGALAAGAYTGTGRYLVTFHGATLRFRLLLNENELRALVPALPSGYLSGFIVADNASDPANDVDIGAGACRDSSDVVNLAGAAMTKRLDAAWAAGSGNGAVLLSGTLSGTIVITTDKNVVGSGTSFTTAYFVGDFITTAGGQCRRITQIFSNTAMTVESNWSFGESGVTYKRGGKARNSVMALFAIYKDADGSVDYAMSARVTPVDLPTGYSKYRRIRFKLTDGSGNNISDLQQGDWVFLRARAQNPTVATSLSGSSASYTVNTVAPLNMLATIRITLRTGGGGVGPTYPRYAYVRQVSQTSGSPTDANKGSVHFAADASDGAVGGYPQYAEVNVLLNASAQFAVDLAWSGTGVASDSIVSYVAAWLDPRGRG